MLIRLLVFCFILIVGSIEYTLNQNDRILIVGDHNTAIASTASHGFIELLRTEFFNSIRSRNITVDGLGYIGKSTKNIAEKLYSTILDYYQPTKIILALSNADLHSDDVLLVNEIRYDLESIVARLVVRNIQVILCSVMIHGEKVDGSNDFDDQFDAHIIMLKSIAKNYDVMYIDLLNPMMRFLQFTNIENLHSNILTINGKILNERGHMIVATTLLRNLGLKGKLSIDQSVLIHRVEVAKQAKETINSNEKLQPMEQATYGEIYENELLEAGILTA